MPVPENPLAVAHTARQASRTLAVCSHAQRNAALLHMAAAVAEAAPSILEANALDLKRADADELTPSTLARLQLNRGKLQEMTQGMRSVAALPDPLGRMLQATELDSANPNSHFGPAAASTDSSLEDEVRRDGLYLEKISVPLGVLLTIFEARPDAVTQIASLALKSGNAAILKPGREVEATASALVDVLRTSLMESGLPKDAVQLVLGRDKVNELLALHREIDLVIPRGGRQLVEHVQANTHIPVLGHAEGVCHVYVDREADLELALRVIEDAKTDYPAACNAVETVLVHRDVQDTFVPRLAELLTMRGVRLFGDTAVRSLVTEAQPLQDWHTEYGDLAISVGVVNSMEAAIAHIHEHGSAHTESILTENRETAERFLREVDAAGVFHNCSTRFADGFRYGFGAEVGISTSKLHARGPVGLDGLTTYKYMLRGNGHRAGDYRGPGARQFTHRHMGGNG